MDIIECDLHDKYVLTPEQFNQMQAGLLVFKDQVSGKTLVPNQRGLIHYEATGQKYLVFEMLLSMPLMTF